MIDFLCRLLPPPDHPIIELGKPPDDREWLVWEPGDGSMCFEGCEHRRWVSDVGSIRIGVRNGLVEGVIYDMDVYRETGLHVRRKVRFIAASHGLQRYLDNGHGAELFRSDANVFGVYTYRVDWFHVHLTSTALKTVYDEEDELG